MESSWKAFNAKEIEIIESIFEVGIEKKLFKIEDTREVAELFLDLLKALRHRELKYKELLYLDQNEYENLVQKASLLLKIFINGLKFAC